MGRGRVLLREIRPAVGDFIEGGRHRGRKGSNVEKVVPVDLRESFRVLSTTIVFFVTDVCYGVARVDLRLL
jgi:hypothetical protein